MKLPNNYSINADVLRILSGFGVVLIHVTDPFIVYPSLLGIKGFEWEIVNIMNMAFRFSVPLFIMLSGLLILKPIKNFNVRSFYKNRFMRVGIPLLFWAVFYIMWVHLVEHSISIYRAVEMVVSTGLDFLYFLFIILALYYIAPFFIIFITFTKRNGHAYLFYSALAYTILLTLSGFLLPSVRIDTGHNMFTIFLPYIVFFIGGFYLKTIKLPPFYTAPLLTLLGLLVIGVAVITNGDFSSYLRNNGSTVIIAMTFTVFLLGYHSRLISELAHWPQSVRFIRFISASIFGIYLVHIFVIYMLNLILPFYSETNVVSSNMLGIIIIKIVIVFLISLFITTIGRKIPIVKMIFGE